MVNAHADDTPGLRPGRACRACVSIKARCIPKEEALDKSRVCVRCHRLGKECTTPPAAVRKRQKTSHVRRLEDRIEELKELVRQGGGAETRTRRSPDNVQDLVQSSSFDVPVVNSDRNSYISPLHLPLTPLSGDGGPQEPAVEPRVPGAFPLGFQIYAPPQRAQVSSHMTGMFPVKRQQELLVIFRRDMTKHIPFVVVPENATAESMSKDKPFLLSACVVVAASGESQIQRSIMHDMLEYLGRQTLSMGEKSLDLVQGMMVMITWYQYFTHGNPQLMNLLHLCHANLVDMGLNRAQGQGLLNLKICQSGLANNAKRTYEDMRACLGMYFLSAKLASVFKRIDFFRWTDYVEECCRTLETDPEASTDRNFAASVRLQHIVERYSTLDGVKPSKHLPLRSYVALCTGELDSLRKNLHPVVRNSIGFMHQIQVAEVILFDKALLADNDDTSCVTEVLYRCLYLVMELFEAILTFPTEQYASITFLKWMHVTHALDLLAKLCTVSRPGWDAHTIRDTHDFLRVMQRLKNNLWAANAYEQSKQPDQPFTRFSMYAQKLGKAEEWYIAKVSAEQHNNPTTTTEDVFPTNAFNNVAFDFPLFQDLEASLYMNLNGLPVDIDEGGMPGSLS